MKNNKGKYYILMMAGILILTFLVPVIFRAASRAFINRFALAAAQAQTEADEDRYRVMEGFTESDESSLIADPENKDKSEDVLSSDDSDTCLRYS